MYILLRGVHVNLLMVVPHIMVSAIRVENLLSKRKPRAGALGAYLTSAAEGVIYITGMRHNNLINGTCFFHSLH